MSYTIEEYRLLADFLLYYAGGSVGRSEDDLVYKTVTEGRDVGAHQNSYSSCGDLAHWLHYRLGLRGNWINRKEHAGWKVGLNVSRLAYAPVSDTQVSGPYYCGDVGIIWNSPQGTDAHVLVIRSAQESWTSGRNGERTSVGYTLETSEYGQPGGALKSRTLTNGKIGSRKLQRIVRLAECIDYCAGLRNLVRPDIKTLTDALAYGEAHFSGETLDNCESLLARPWTL